MLRFGIGVAIGWFAYETLQKKGESIPDIVKSCVAKTVEVFKKDSQQSVEGKEECAK